MKRSEFLDEITDWGELLDFCREYDVDVCSDIYTDADYDEVIEEDVSERECGWYELMEALQRVPTQGEYFCRHGWLDYSCVDNDDAFERWKRAVLDDCDYGDLWEPETGEDPDEAFDPFDPFGEEEEDEEEQSEEWPGDVAALLSICESSVRIIGSKY